MRRGRRKYAALDCGVPMADDTVVSITGVLLPEMPARRNMKTFLGLLLRLPRAAITACALAAVLLAAIGIFRGGTTLQKLFAENARLKEAIANLTDEGKIGYAKVLSQSFDESGEVASTELKFVETARDNELETVLEKRYVIEGDIVHFDALIVKFTDKMVMGGSRKSLYLWRRVYGEKQPPGKGFAIETPGLEPRRYETLLDELPVRHRRLFWSSIWDLANDPYRLKQYGIEAIYGNVTYARLKPGLLYVFRITATGQVYPDIVPDL
jgi:hypothetical protein